MDEPEDDVQHHRDHEVEQNEHPERPASRNALKVEVMFGDRIEIKVEVHSHSSPTESAPDHGPGCNLAQEPSAARRRRWVDSPGSGRWRAAPPGRPCPWRLSRSPLSTRADRDQPGG